jgi:hypothetical protein
MPEGTSRRGMEHVTVPSLPVAREQAMAPAGPDES